VLTKGNTMFRELAAQLRGFEHKPAAA